MPNRTLPEPLKLEPRLLACSRQARLFFFHLWLTVDDYRRAPLGPSPASPTVLRAMCHPAEPEIRIPDVARWLHELQASGAIVMRDSDRGWYVEIAESLWYRREDYAEKQPKYGPRLEHTPTQATLPLGPVNKVPEDLPCKYNPIQALRVESGSGNANESRPREDSAIRKPGGGKDSAKRSAGRFSAGEHSKADDPVWVDFCGWMADGALTCEELWMNGARYLALLRDRRREFVDALAEGQLAGRTVKITNKGAWFLAVMGRNGAREASA